MEMEPPRSISTLLLLLLLLLEQPAISSASDCRTGCDLALASYFVSSSANLQLNLTYISSLFNQSYQQVVPYNPSINPDSIPDGSRINVGFTCDCINGSLSHLFPYTVLKGDTYESIADSVYANLTTESSLANGNMYPATNIPDGVEISVPVSCYCGDDSISRDYGLFETYPLRPGESLTSVASDFNLSSDTDLLKRYNPGVDFNSGKGIVFVPTKDQTGSYRPLTRSASGITGGGIAGISVAVIVVLLVIAICLYFGLYKRKKVKRASSLPSNSENKAILQDHGNASPMAAFTVDRSVEFSYEELAKATNEFSMTNKIGQGGFGVVYYAELRGEKAAIKKMDMEASREFLAELKVLTHVHHLNLVRLIGYCTEGSLFLVYEYIENGNLSEHLRGSGRDPLLWSARVQIALDAARGLEYIHEHTVPVYIHRDIKSANILIDKNFRGKVADFGLTKLTLVGNTQTRLVGTFGYMSPEYAQFGEVSPKVDVFAFGVVLFELISAKEAIVRTDSGDESKGLVAMFEDALNHPEPREELQKLVDPKLGDEYQMDMVYKMAQLAKACTEENPQLRPSMRSVVVALSTLSSSTEDWDVRAFYENQALLNLMSGR